MKSISDMTEPELTDLLNALAKQIVASCLALETETPYFALILFNDPKIGQYISNCERRSMISALRDCADRLESRDYIPREG